MKAKLPHFPRVYLRALGGVNIHWRRTPQPKAPRPARSFLSAALQTPAPWTINTILTREPNRPNAAVEWAVGFGLGAGQGGMLVLPFAMAVAQSDMQFLGLSLFGMLLTGMAGVGISVGMQANWPAQQA